MKIEFYKPFLPPWGEVGPEIKNAYNQGRLYPWKYTDALEQQLKEYFGVSNVILSSNCSDGLIALLSFVGRVKVAIPAYTFCSTYHAVIWNGLRTVLVDVDENGMMDPECLKDLLNKDPEVKAVVPVHWWGEVVDPAVLAICKEKGIWCFCDGAQAFGSMYDGQPIGKLGDASCFSMAVTKPFACGEGAVITTNNDDVASWVRQIILNGRVPGSLSAMPYGLNGKIQEFNSIIGLFAMKYLEDGRAKRQRIAQTYEMNLAHLPIRYQISSDHCNTIQSYFGIWCENREVRDLLATHLKENEIEIKEYCPSISKYSACQVEVFKADVSERLGDTVINLPCYADMPFEHVDFVIEKIKEYFK